MRNMKAAGHRMWLSEGRVVTGNAEPPQRSHESDSYKANCRIIVSQSMFSGLARAGVELLFLLAFCLSTQYVWAQEMPHDPPESSAEGSSHTYLSASPSTDALSAFSLDTRYALGSWGGLRTVLGRHGIVPTVIMISDPFGNVHGGEQIGAADYSLVGADIRIDTGSITGWKGGQFDIGGAVNWGTSLSRSYIGNSFAVQLADCAEAQPRLTYLSYTQLLLKDHISLRMGRLTLNSVYGEEFMGSEYFKNFTTIGLDLIPEGVFFNVSGAAGYPRTTWGARLRYSPTRRFYAQAATYNSDPNQLSGSHHGLDLSVRGPIFAIGEVGFKHFARLEDSKPDRNIKAGGFYTGGTHYTVSQAALKPVQGLFGFYALGDQRLFRLRSLSGTPKADAELARWGDAERERHVGVFASVVAVPEPRTNTTPYFFDLGAMSYGLNPGRPRDFLGLGFAYGSYSRGPQLAASISNTQPISPPVPPNEETLEVTYGFVARPGMVLQPSLQYVVHPKGIASIPNTLRPGEFVPNALAIGVSTVINF